MVYFGRNSQYFGLYSALILLVSLVDLSYYGIRHHDALIRFELNDKRSCKLEQTLCLKVHSEALKC